MGSRRGSDRRRLGAVLGILLAALAVLPVAAVAGPTKLQSPAVSPTSGTTATVFTFSVTYRNREGSAPDSVEVVVGGVAHAMSTTDSDWKRGATFSWSSTLPVGAHDVAFRGMSRDRFEDQVAGPNVVVTAPPTPTPKPTPEPTPKPTPKPTPTSDPEPTDPSPPDSTAKPSSPSSTPAPDSSSAPAPGSGLPSPTPGGRPAQPGPDAGDPRAPSDGDPDASTPPLVAGPIEPTPPDDPAGAPDDADPVPSWGDLTHALSTLGLDPIYGGELRLLPAFVGSAGAVALAMAFGFFGKRRRDGEPPEPDEVLEARASRGDDQVANAALVPGAGQAGVATAPLDAEAAMPRWRRPSLLQARKADPIRDAAPVVRLSFDQGAVQAVDGLERRLIRYHVVELLDAPDELRAARIGSLTQGDEVQLVERSGTHWRVLCPDGREGWIHRMTLGEVVGEPAPTAAQTWATPSIEREDVDDDVLAAFMAARGRA